MAQNGVASMPSPSSVKRLKSSSAGSLISDPFDLPPPTFDLDTWAANYDGPILPHRLAHIALRCQALRAQALMLAIAAARLGKNVREYVQLCDAATGMGYPELAQKDEEWVAKQDDDNKRELARLESELRGYKNNLIKESIRMGQEDLATHHLLTGGPPPDQTNTVSHSTTGLPAAYAAFGKMREHASTPTHIASMTLNLMFTSLLQAVHSQSQGHISTSHWNQVVQNTHRLRSSGVKEEEQLKLTPPALVAGGIAQMELGNYREAANTFTAVPASFKELGPVHGHDFKRQVASPNDLAIYGGLCALATMSRDDLQTLILGGAFRTFLEEEPHMRKAISLYTTAKYQSCLATLRHYYSDWSLDIFLGARVLGGGESHVDRLFAKIREKSITAYFSSFSEVSLSALASTFPPLIASTDQADQAAAIEMEVLRMIESGTLAARLDIVDGKLICPSTDLRSKTHAQAIETAEEVERNLLLRLHKVNVVVAGLEIKKAAGGATGWGNPNSDLTVGHGSGGLGAW